MNYPRKIYYEDSLSSTDTTRKKYIPPWCSSGKVYEGRASKVVTPALWEMRSSYPLRVNIWEYLHGDKTRANVNCFGKRKTRKTCCKQPVTKRGSGKRNVILFSLLLAVLGVLIYASARDLIVKTNLIATRGITYLIAAADKTVTSNDNECFNLIKGLSKTLLRTQMALRLSTDLYLFSFSNRNTQRLQKMTLKSKMLKTVASKSCTHDNILKGALVTKGFDTEVWVGRVTLWGVIPLWKTAPPPNVVMSLLEPKPSDCWPIVGKSGEIIIELRHHARVECVSLEHIHPDSAQSAPKLFVLYGILENGTRIKTVEAEYQNKGPAKQYYPLRHRNKSLKRFVFGVLTNHGNTKYTCIYRMHLHGKYITSSFIPTVK